MMFDPKNPKNIQLNRSYAPSENRVHEIQLVVNFLQRRLDQQGIIGELKGYQLFGGVDGLDTKIAFWYRTGSQTGWQGDRKTSCVGEMINLSRPWSDVVDSVEIAWSNLFDKISQIEKQRKISWDGIALELLRQPINKYLHDTHFKRGVNHEQKPITQVSRTRNTNVETGH